MKNDATTEHYEMLQDYFRNVAIWLAPPPKQSSMFSVATWNSLFSVQGMQELGPLRPPFSLGPQARDVLGRTVSKCTIRRWIWDFVLPELYLPWRKIIDGPCLTCPPFELLEVGALGVLVSELLPLRTQSIEKDIGGDELDRLVHQGLERALKRAAPELTGLLDKELTASAKQFSELAARTKGTQPKHECNPRQYR